MVAAWMRSALSASRGSWNQTKAVPKRGCQAVSASEGSPFRVRGRATVRVGVKVRVRVRPWGEAQG